MSAAAAAPDAAAAAAAAVPAAGVGAHGAAAAPVGAAGPVGAVQLQAGAGVANTELIQQAELDIQRTVEDILTVLRGGRVALLMGYAGTGKTTVTKRVAELMSSSRVQTISHANAHHVLCTATTGLAATALQDGCTIHSACGISPALEEVATAYLRQENFQTLRDFSPARAKKLFDYLAANTDSPWRPLSKLRDVQVLIIDEIFLASSLTFTMIVTICQGVRDNFTEPFGGLSVLLVGDPLQGTSIGSDENCLTHDMQTDKGCDILRRVLPDCSAFVKSAIQRDGYPMWQNVFLLTRNLRTREEKADSLYHTALQEMRHGTISAHAQSFFQANSRDATAPQAMSKIRHNAMHLYHTRAEVQAHNSNLQSSAAVETFEGELRAVDPNANVADFYKRKEDGGYGWRKKFAVEQHQQFHVGQRVMLRYNDNVADHRVNGTMCTIVEFVREGAADGAGGGGAAAGASGGAADGNGAADSNGGAGAAGDAHPVEGAGAAAGAGGPITGITLKCVGDTDAPPFTVERVDFDDWRNWPTKQGKHAQYKAQKMAVLKAFPLVPAAALTFALVQGQEFPKDQQLVVHFPQTNNAIGCGVGYMVLSRVRRSHDLFVANFRKDLVYAHPEAIKLVVYAERWRQHCNRINTAVGLTVRMKHMGKEVEAVVRRQRDPQGDASYRTITVDGKHGLANPAINAKYTQYAFSAVPCQPVQPEDSTEQTGTGNKSRKKTAAADRNTDGGNAAKKAKQARAKRKSNQATASQAAAAATPAAAAASALIVDS